MKATIVTIAMLGTAAAMILAGCGDHPRHDSLTNYYYETKIETYEVAPSEAGEIIFAETAYAPPVVVIEEPPVCAPPSVFTSVVFFTGSAPRYPHRPAFDADRRLRTESLLHRPKPINKQPAIHVRPAAVRRQPKGGVERPKGPRVEKNKKKHQEARHIPANEKPSLQKKTAPKSPLGKDTSTMPGKGLFDRNLGLNRPAARIRDRKPKPAGPTAKTARTTGKTGKSITPVRDRKPKPAGPTAKTARTTAKTGKSITPVRNRKPKPAGPTAKPARTTGKTGKRPADKKLASPQKTSRAGKIGPLPRQKHEVAGRPAPAADPRKVSGRKKPSESTRAERSASSPAKEKRGKPQTDARSATRTADRKRR